MSNRKKIGSRVSADVVEKFEQWVMEKHGKKRTVMGEELEKAMLAHINEDRETRMESKLDEILTHVREDKTTHTHKESEDSVPKRIGKKLDQHDGPMKDFEMDRVIIEVAELPKGDQRTIEGYKERVRQLRYGFEHPSEEVPLWFSDIDQWAPMVDDLLPENERSVFLDDYCMTVEELVEVIEGEAEEKGEHSTDGYVESNPQPMAAAATDGGDDVEDEEDDEDC